MATILVIINISGEMEFETSEKSKKCSIPEKEAFSISNGRQRHGCSAC